MKKLRYFVNNLRSSYFGQFLILTLLAFLGFYKIFSFTFHHNREIVSITPVLSNPTFIALMKSHVFIHFFNYHIFGAKVWGWYLTGLILHILATCMIVVFISKLTHKRILGFFVGLWFVVSTAWHDVVTFGTQESLVAAQLFLYLVGIYFYTLFREKRQKWLYYLLSLFFFLLFTPLRESSLLFYLLLFIYDLTFYFPWQKFTLIKNITKRKNIALIIKFLSPLIPFFLIALFYVLVRNSYGGSPDDFSDGRVKLKAFLLLEGEYLDYLKYGIISFGSYLPPHVIPYPVLNFVRNLVTSYITFPHFKMYFFPVMGWAIYLGLWLVVLKQRGRKIFKILLFAVGLVTVPTLFYSFAFTADEYFFLRDYIFDENRWRYIAFFGTSLFLIVYFHDFLKKRISRKLLARTALTIIIGNLILNIGLMWFIEDKMYNESFKPQKLFYGTFLKTFPTFENNYAIYAYPKSDFFGDYMWEWFGLKNLYYPDLTNLRPDWLYGEMNEVLKVVEKNPSFLNDFFFIDFRPDRGIINYTKRVKDIILHQELVTLSVNKKLPLENKISLPVEKIYPVEFPYNLEVTLKANLDWNKYNSKDRSNFSEIQVNALVKYYQSHIFFFDKVKVFDICGGAQNFPSSSAFNADHLVDGNFGPRSLTYADCHQANITLDLGEEKDIGGVIMGGIENDSHLPFHYFYETSTDGKNWEKVMEISENKKSDMMDKWPEIYRARYVRITILSTQTGIWVMLDEIEPILAEAVDIFSYWSSRQQLTSDLHGLFSNLTLSQTREYFSLGINKGFGKFYWSTNMLSPLEEESGFYFPFFIDGNFHTYTMPIYESEYYSGPKQFLKRYIEELNFDFGDFPGEIVIDKVELVPTILIVPTT